MLRWLLGVPVLLICAVVGWTWVTLKFSYSSGDRTGYVQKISHKGWLCKTWEGELAMVPMPGVQAQVFLFSVRDEAVAQRLRDVSGQRVRLTYDQHRGVPTSCFGETEYFVTGVQVFRQ
ncbi:MAG: hypothetical protein FJW39_16530 [Acidobacteria bacterium]|nr:hypothetical protein [Acidobacteriota bacterium]